MDDERRLTLEAVGKGARLYPGKYWDLEGTFLFATYVMTALGFGAPVPQTLAGRSSALVYALLSVPVHLYLIINASRCLVANVEVFQRIVEDSITKSREQSNISKRGLCFSDKKTFILKFLKPNLFRWLWAGRGLPVALLSYYTIGAVLFGVVRDKHFVDVVMFPLEFTTSGGLEYVAGPVRLLYALYVEGAMCLLAGALATWRRCTHGSVDELAARYRLHYVKK